MDRRQNIVARVLSMDILSLLEFILSIQFQLTTATMLPEGQIILLFKLTEGG